MKKNFLISTGGSGGHVTPAKILHDHLIKEANIIFSTDLRGLKYLDQDIYDFEIINTPKLNNLFFLPFNLLVVLYLTIKSLFLLKKEKIEKVFSTGGYMSLPLILAARIMKKKIYLVEPNHILGRANKFFLRSCKKIFCYSKAVKKFPDNLKDRIVTIYPLVKKNVYDLKLHNQNKKNFTILIVGGSQGADIFDKNLKKSIAIISRNMSIEVIQQTSEKNILNLKEFYSKNRIENRIFSFEKNLTSIIQEADLCITRAGASTLAELSILNLPFIAVPLPTSKDNHQYENASFYEKNDCCWIIDQKSFEEKIEDLLKNILIDRSAFFRKKENLKKLNYQNTWNNVNQKIIENLNEN